MKLSIVITNYKSKKYLLLCLASINRFVYKGSPLRDNFEVIIVNNEKDNLILSVDYPFLNPKIINTGKNIGFGLANNLGAIMTRGKYLLFLNPDTIFTDNTLFKALDYLEENSATGVLGLGIIDNTRKAPQNWTCGKRMTWKSILFKNTINKPWNKKIPRTVDWVSATALIVRKNLFKQVKGFDKNFFMYFEDQDLCLRIKSLGKKIVFYPQAKVLHFNGKSWKTKKPQKKAYQNSQLYFFKKYNSTVGYYSLRLVYKIKNLF